METPPRWDLNPRSQRWVANVLTAFFKAKEENDSGFEMILQAPLQALDSHGFLKQSWAPQAWSRQMFYCWRNLTHPRLQFSRKSRRKAPHVSDILPAISSPSSWIPKQEQDIDIYSFHINATVTSRYAITVITSRMANRLNESKEVHFQVQIPKHAFISRFGMTMEGKMYDGVVKEKEEAQQQYSEAVSRGESAGIVSSVGRRSLKPRQPMQMVTDFKIDVYIHESPGISFLAVNGELNTKELANAVTTTRSDKEVWVNFYPTWEQQTNCNVCGPTGLKGDLIINYDVERQNPSGALQESEGYFVHYFAPTDVQRIPKNVVFVIDRSGSMCGRKIQQTCEALLKILGDISEEDHFGLVTFDNHIDVWNPELLPASEGNLQKAKVFVRKITDGGSTNINDAVLKGVKMINRHQRERSAPILILLTDGAPNTGKNRRKYNKNSEVSIHISISYFPSSPSLQVKVIR
ncbi:inter-alpha-trypsin inhibitor heavy chain H4-like [Hoplias malabaricus]|uniref:inter-alpha-trypsin inhibitor heavy chain H4-like n=1 Tax=Hoplias malabaricus TaxID=27720 RepID=UPI003461A202